MDDCCIVRVGLCSSLGPKKGHDGGRVGGGVSGWKRRVNVGRVCLMLWDARHSTPLHTGGQGSPLSPRPLWL